MRHQWTTRQQMTQMICSLSRQQKVCLLVIEVVTALGCVQLLREATKPSATKNEAFSNKNPGADEDFLLLYILYERLRDWGKKLR
jgi:hypothetical protein